MRVVLDTNVVVSAALTPHGACARIVDLLLAGAFELCADDRILGEYDAVLRRPRFGFAAGDVAALMDVLRCVAIPVTAAPVATVLPDPDDLPFLEVAATAEAILVTGNLRHFPKKDCQGVAVLSPKEFLERLRGR
jgi:putative PIN family toxin of toxin-antitoxin system